MAPDFIFMGLSFFCAYVYGGVAEWVIHKYVLHGLGKKKNSIFSFHWHSHHKTCRKNNNFDANYKHVPVAPSVKKEVFFLSLLSIIHFPILFFMPYFFIGICLYMCRYFYLHRRAHLDVEWGKKKMPWHYDHHMGKNQDSNWGVTVEWPDRLFNTREKTQ